MNDTQFGELAGRSVPGSIQELCHEMGRVGLRGTLGDAGIVILCANSGFFVGGEQY